MFVVHLEESTGEWTLCKYAFSNYYAADEYAAQLHVNYVIEQLEEY